MKNIVLDTSTLIYDPKCLYNFDGNKKVIPITVIEELDGLKKASGEVGVNARLTSRIIQESIDKNGKCGEGVLEVYVDNTTVHLAGIEDCNDTRIIGVAKKLSEAGPTVLVSKDLNLRIIAHAFGIEAEDYYRDHIDDCKVGNIITLTDIDEDIIDAIHKRYARGIEGDFIPEHIQKDNQCFILKGYGKSVLARYRNGHIKKIQEFDRVSNIKPRNAEQKFLIDMLMDQTLDCVVVNGFAGSGKTLCSMAGGMEQVDAGIYDRMTITKVIKSVGETIGLLPGSKEEKMMEWLAPFFDNLELILKKSAVTWQNLVTADKLELDALEHIRGRSLMNRWVVIDEMQNCEPAHLKTIVSRIGSGSKLILLGDYSQIDNQYLSKKNNGLVYAINRLYGLDNVGVLQLQKTERSKLAEVAIKHL